MHRYLRTPNPNYADSITLKKEPILGAHIECNMYTYFLVTEI